MPTTNTYGSVPVVLDRKKNPVAAQWLQDTNGNYIIDPTTAKPYIVDLSFDFGAFVDKYSALNIDTNPLMVPFVLGVFTHDFNTGGPSDFQRSYNGQLNGVFVSAFTNSTSFLLGVASKAA